MVLLFFHLYDGADLIRDPDGAELSLADAVARALHEARWIIADDARSGRIDLNQRIDIADAGGVLLHSLRFRDAVDIVGLR